MTRDERRDFLAKACGLWFLLDKKAQEDLIDGKCTYSQHDNVPIIDYGRKHLIFSEMENSN